MAGRISHMERCFAWFPQYLECHVSTIKFLMHAPGPLPTFCRYYIAILAASRHACLYYIRQLEVLFVLNGGDPAWLRPETDSEASAEKDPDRRDDTVLVGKLRRLRGLNALLAHQPWRLRREDLAALIDRQSKIGKSVV